MNMRWFVAKLIISIVLHSDLNLVGSKEYIRFEIIQGFIDDVFAIRWRCRTTTRRSQWQQREIRQLFRAFGNRMISLKWKCLDKSNDWHTPCKEQKMNTKSGSLTGILTNVFDWINKCPPLTIIQREYGNNGQIFDEMNESLRYNWHARWIWKTD